MNLYLDDNADDIMLAALLRKAQHQVVRPVEAGLASRSDPVHLEFAVGHQLVLLTKDAKDFRELHDLIQTTKGAHLAIIILRYDNDASRDMQPKQVVAALGKLERSGFHLTNQIVILNQWR